MIREHDATHYDGEHMNLVTIVIPCFQERDFIRACLESVIAFEKPDDTTTEIFIIDGMSTDRTRTLLTKCCI